MAEKFKSLALNKPKIADVDGERQVTFVASTTSEDRDYEHVNIGTFRLPTKGGGSITVNQIPKEGVDNVDVPLLTDHDMTSVDKTLGSVRQAFWDAENQALICVAGISSRSYAQDKLTLIEEGHLDNAFSIQYRDFDHDYDTATDSGGEIVEISLVTRGSNKDAKVLAVKALKGDNPMDKDEAKVETPEVKAELPVEAVEEAPAEETKPEAEESEATVAPEAKVEETDEEIVVTIDKNAEEEDKEEEEEADTPEKPAEESTNEKETKSMSTQETVAKTIVKEATQTKSTAKAEDYLNTKGAVKDFAKTIADNGRNAMKVWTANLEAKGISGDAILPKTIENIFFKAWQDNPTVIATFGNVNLAAGAVNAFTTESRAQGHKKGDAKADQTITNIRRDLKAKIVYKKLPIDLQDLIDDQTGELLRFRVEELADRLANEIVLGAILGDGRSAPSGSNPDYRVFDGTRGLFSISADITNSTTSGSFASAVARKVTADANDTDYDKAIKTLAKVKGNAKVLIVKEGWKANVLLTKNSQGQYIFQPGTNLEAILDCKIFELPEMEGADYDVIAYAEGAYKLFGTGDMVRTDFDLTYNQDVMLVERGVAGSLAGHYVAAGYEGNESA